MTTDLDRTVTAFKIGQFDSTCAAARYYGVAYSTPYDRLHNTKPRATACEHLQELSPSEEDAILEKVLDLPDRGFHCLVTQCQQIAAMPLESRVQITDRVSDVWYKKFLKLHGDVLHTCFTRSHDYQRARAEDPVAISEWICLVRSNIERCGIVEEGIYNVDETDFLHSRVPS